MYRKRRSVLQCTRAFASANGATEQNKFTSLGYNEEKCRPTLQAGERVSCRPTLQANRVSCLRMARSHTSGFMMLPSDLAQSSVRCKRNFNKMTESLRSVPESHRSDPSWWNRVGGTRICTRNLIIYSLFRDQGVAALATLRS